ncbi:hypothetical protein [Stenotrophomonas sp.]|uniref:hypothetical protein n=1 Tax=Stenotrophomonas sp. TaxID=69392 RepID=UPI0028B1E685|nr:hypothetical protein [Stenotrophomonas sp.]
MRGAVRREAWQGSGATPSCAPTPVHLTDEQMRFNFYGFEVVPQTTRGRWLMFGAIVLSVLMLYPGIKKRGEQIARQTERVAGFDMPAGMKPAWTEHPKENTIELDPRGSIEVGKPLRRGYRLEPAQAQALMESCTERGGQVIDGNDAAKAYPRLMGRLHGNGPICMRTDNAPRRAVSLLQGDTLVIQIANY